MAILKTFLTASALGIVMMLSSLSVAFAGSNINCTCRFAGTNYAVGDIACIRGKLSRCAFVLNNTSWKTIADSCPQASSPDLQQNPVTDSKITVLARMRTRFSIK